MSTDTQSARTIFLDALERPEQGERSQFIADVCGDDPALRAEVLRLLKAHGDLNDFMDVPAAGRVSAIDLPASEQAGATIGRYKLLEQIGEGGMGVVYVAEQTEPVRRRVALKIIKPGMDTRQVISRFEAERQALALMDHPNIARVLDAGTTGDVGQAFEPATNVDNARQAGMPAPHGGRPYFVMELVRGLPITDYCDQAQVDIRSRLELFMTVCHAVQHAHQKGIIHRDIKPSNVLVTLHDGKPVVKVIDFGVAKAIGQNLTERTIYTAFTELIGTPLYMSPEQAELSGLDVDTRSDVYSLGVLLYELLTGHTPFDRDTLVKAGLDEIRRMIREDEPLRPSARLRSLSGSLPLAGRVGEGAGTGATQNANLLSTIADRRGIDQRQLSRTLHGELDWIVMKALEKDRNRRYQSASAFAADIERHLNHEPVEAGPPSALYRLRKFARRRRAVLVTATLVTLSLLVGAGVSIWQSVEANGERQRAQANYLTAREAVGQMLKQVADERLNAIREMKHIRRKLLEDAADFYTRLIEVSPDDAQAYVERGEVYGLLGQPSESVADFAKAVQLVPDDAHSHVVLSRHYSRYGATPYELSVALAHARTAIVIKPRDHIARILYATILAQQRRSKEARAELRRLEKTVPSSVEAFRGLSVAYSYIGDRKLALQYARQAVQNDPNDSKAHYVLGDVLSQLYRTDEALEAFNTAIRLNPYQFSGSTGSHWRRGRILLLQGEYAEALLDFDRAIDIAPWQYINFKDRAVAHFHLKNFDQALADVEKAFSLNPSDLSTLTWVGARFIVECADERYRLGILKLLERAVRDDPRADVLARRGLLYLAVGRHTDAITDLDKATELAKRTRRPSVNMFNDAAWILAEASDEALFDSNMRDLLADCAVELAKAAVRVAPDDGSLLNTLGVAQYRACKYSDAIETLTKARLFHARNAYDEYFLAMANWQLGETNEAKKWLAAAIQRTESNESKNKELLRFRREAEALISAPQATIAD